MGRKGHRERNGAELDFPVGPSGHAAFGGGQIGCVARQRRCGKQGNSIADPDGRIEVAGCADKAGNVSAPILHPETGLNLRFVI